MVINNACVANKAIAFNCSVKLDTEIIQGFLQAYIMDSPVEPITGLSANSSNPSISVGFYRDFASPLEFDFGVSRENRNASALWLSAYLGNYIGNSLGYLNEVLRRIEVGPGNQGITTKLLVQWWRVAATLGGLAGFQVVFGLAALLYCRAGFEMVDDASTLSSMLTDFPIEGKRRQGAVHWGKFVSEGGKVRWIMFTGVGKNIKVP